MVTSVRVWDLPTRLFHWALAVCVLGAYISVKVGGNAIDWHARFGYAALSLILFRLVWGIVGPRYARFAQFIKGPREIIAVLRGRAWRGLGHSPVGAVSVLLMLVVFGLQSVLGLFTTDEIAFDGPLVNYASSDWVNRATNLHNQSEWWLIALVALHVVAVIIHRVVYRHDLVTPMIVGDTSVADEQLAVPARDDARVRIKAMIVMALCAGFVAYLSL
jgi:cytochrome b